MRAAVYTEQGPAQDVLRDTYLDDPAPASGEVLITVHYSGVNPGEVKKRGNTFGTGMPYAMVIPHSDGAGTVEQVGEGVPRTWLGKRVLCYGAQSYRPFGTAAEKCCVPVTQVVELPHNVDLRQAAQMGIPGITAHRAIHAHGALEHDTVLIQGALGAVGQCAVALAKQVFRTVLATVRKAEDVAVAKALGADHVLLSNDRLAEEVLALFPEGIDHVVEVAFAANVQSDVALLRNGGSIATYATDNSPLELDHWPLAFKNITVHFLGSDDFTPTQKHTAAEDLVALLASGWPGLPIGEEYPLDRIVEAHQHVEEGRPGRAVVRVRKGDG